MFKITKDIIDNGRMNGKYLGGYGRMIAGVVMKPLGSKTENNAAAIAAFEAAEKVRMRLLDDDANPYFELEMTKAQADGGEDDVFEPLDFFGAGYGCTALQMHEGGVWVALN